ncbi:MAG: hypothetical protein PHO14_09020 [Kiritimatiellae bacterium]|nr:hypothetical protein [Kiritimatiellia bacterium]
MATGKDRLDFSGGDGYTSLHSFRKGGGMMNHMKWALSIAAGILAGSLSWAVAASAPDSYTKIEANSLLRTPQNAWARAILFSEWGGTISKVWGGTISKVKEDGIVIDRTGNDPRIIVANKKIKVVQFKAPKGGAK